MSRAIRTALTLLALCFATQPAPAGAQSKVVLRGAGATFPAPLYKKWVSEYVKAEPTVAIDYRDVGSGEGTKRFLAGSVDFGASDAGLSDEELARGAKLLPTTAGLIALAYNLPGYSAPLRLPRTVYPEIFAGRIKKWNDPRILAANPELKVGDRDITLAVRLDASGTTYAFTNHLTALTKGWRADTLVGWPGRAMLARGNEGVAAAVQRNAWTIGYVEYGYAKRLGLKAALLENKEGKFVEPSAASGEATIASNLNEVPASLRVFMPDPAGEGSYPMIALTWLLVRERYDDPAKAEAIRRFAEWALTAGQPYSGELGFVPLPQGLIERARAVAREIR
ncbi:MAG TPA: phosphate ABC transporter substrate-binding protein PstS [Burkholderiales bacterium]|nr:phosphate ABC transporter substrate-binding protein PstS [Burkholderiales bacterium]